MTYYRPKKPCIYCGRIMRTDNKKRHQQSKLCLAYQRGYWLKQSRLNTT